LDSPWVIQNTNKFVQHIKIELFYSHFWQKTKYRNLTN
jgi:hypothetical protein